MTESELLSTISEIGAQNWQITEYVLTVVTGYLLIAHFIGAKLNRFQVSVVNGLYLLMHSMGIWTSYGGMQRLHYYAAQLSELDPSSPSITSVEGGSWVLWSPVVLGLMVMTACLTFMWNVRHKRPSGNSGS